MSIQTTAGGIGNQGNLHRWAPHSPSLGHRCQKLTRSRPRNATSAGEQQATRAAQRAKNAGDPPAAAWGQQPSGNQCNQCSHQLGPRTTHPSAAWDTTTSPQVAPGTGTCPTQPPTVPTRRRKTNTTSSNNSNPHHLSNITPAAHTRRKYGQANILCQARGSSPAKSHNTTQPPNHPLDHDPQAGSAETDAGSAATRCTLTSSSSAASAAGTRRTPSECLLAPPPTTSKNPTANPREPTTLRIGRPYSQGRPHGGQQQPSNTPQVAQAPLPLAIVPRGRGAYITPGTHPAATGELHRPGLSFDHVVKWSPGGINTVYNAYHILLSYLENRQDPTQFLEFPHNDGWTYAHQVSHDTNIHITTILATAYYNHDRIACRLLDWNHPDSDVAYQSYAWELAAKYHAGTEAGRRGVLTEDLFRASGEENTLSQDPGSNYPLFHNGGDLQVRPGPAPPVHQGRFPRPIMQASAKYPTPWPASSEVPRRPRGG